MDVHFTRFVLPSQPVGGKGYFFLCFARFQDRLNLGFGGQLHYCSNKSAPNATIKKAQTSMKPAMLARMFLMSVSIFISKNYVLWDRAAEVEAPEYYSVHPLESSATLSHKTNSFPKNPAGQGG